MSTFGRWTLLITVAILLTNQAFAAGSNNPPPAGPVILDLNGTAIPHAYANYTASFVATSSTTDLSFAFREDPAFLFLSNVSLTTGGGANLLVNGDFNAGPVGASAPTGWTYLNTFGATFGGVVQAGGGVGVNNAYVDGAVQAYDAITQAVSTTVGATYTVSFELNDNSGLTTFSQLSTNGDTTDTGGNGADLIVYGGAGVPTIAAAPGPIPGAGLLSYIAIGLLCLGTAGWRRLRAA
jgi:hypothetical protein